MNFLSHYYFDHIPGDAYFNLGLIFPDIVRNFVPGTRLNYTLEIPDQTNEQQLLKGCIQHVQSDKVFHAWEGFHAAMEVVTNDVRQSPYDFKRDWFIAHILVELTMDHYLILQDSNLANKLYTDFEKVDTNVLTSFLARHKFSKFDQFLKGFDRFMNHRYLNSYGESDNIVYALGKICNKMRLEPFSDKQKGLLKELVSKLNQQMPQYVRELQVELK